MTVGYRLDRQHGRLANDAGELFDPVSRCWNRSVDPPTGEPVDAMAAATWVQRQSGAPLRVPIGVIGPREATAVQLTAAEAVGRGLGTMGFVVVCGGRQGVMEAVCRGVEDAGGLSIGLLPEPEPWAANRHAGVVIATGIGEARNALIARAAYCLVAIGNSYGTLSEVALGRHFGKRVIGLEGAADVAGVVHVDSVEAALAEVAQCVLTG